MRAPGSSSPGFWGGRVEANTDHWLLRAPQANPGMIEMFRVRDRRPVPNLVPWAGEFVGKYLISAIQALRLSSNPALQLQVSNVVAELLATQAEDGYLGPFPRASRLTGNWDLWGHYHVMQALMLWHEATGDRASLQACRRAGDLICATFLDSPRRVYDAGSHEMNMAVIHGLGQLHRLTGEPRYLRMMHEVEKDWERAGDYLRSGVAGVEFFQSPRPRWESLHDLQGLVELYRITGDVKYRRAFEHHWRSIARWDRHNTGGFTSGEQATGNPYSPGAIETCCTIAWMALTIDMLQLTGDPLCADELEISTFNAATGAQHPSGRWWTYSTPMDGVREASAHSIVFQSRAGTPELNCCSVNGPRALGMLSEWAVMRDEAGLIVNHYGPGSFHGRLADGAAVALHWETDYPLSGRVQLRIEPEHPAEIRLRLRVPGWSKQTQIAVAGEPIASARAGTYFEASRRWQKGDTVEIDFDMSPRFVTGDREAAGKVSIYRGPLLLAYDQRFNAVDEGQLPSLELRRLNEARSVRLPREEQGNPLLAPWLLFDLPAENGRTVRVCDFASAGATGTRYLSWLAAKDCPPPPVVTRLPADGAGISGGAALFRWTGPNTTNDRVAAYQLQISPSPDFSSPGVTLDGVLSNRVVLDEATMRRLAPSVNHYWRVAAFNAHGATESVRPAARFFIDPALPAKPLPDGNAGRGPDGLLIHASLRGGTKPEWGELRQGNAFVAESGPNGQSGNAVRVDGKSQMVVYGIDEFPEEDFSVAVWVRVENLPAGRIGQIFSAWCAGMDDPLRLCVDGGKLFARIEAGQAYGTAGVPLAPGAWHHVAAVKAGDKLKLFIDGRAGPSATVPRYLHSSSREVALGGNPRFSGNEHLAAAFADFRMFARALNAVEVTQLARPR